jgi:hypothetical protein
MIAKEKQLELEKTHIILMATLDYLLKKYTGSMVFDEWDPVADHYLREKKLSEDEYQASKLELLQQRLLKLLESLRMYADVKFENYIKEHTGYEVDLFEQLRRDVAAVAAKGRIENVDEANSISSMYRVCRNKSADNEEIAILENLLKEFAELKHPANENSQTTSSEIKQVVVQITIPPPPIFGESTVVNTNDNTIKVLNEDEYNAFQVNNGISEYRSPDGKRGVITRSNGIGKDASVEVSVQLGGGSGCVYHLRGAGFLVEAYWKDNSTITIKTKKDHLAETKHEQVSSFDDVVKIEYLEV